MGGTFGRYSLIFFLALSVRLLSWNSVFLNGETAWVGGPDAYYHARRAELAAAGAPLTHDLWLNYPRGEKLHWPELYDRCLGWLLRLSSLQVLAFVPVFLGACGAVFFASFARRLLPDGWMPASIMYATLPAVVYPSAVGAIDHHALEVCLAGALLAGLCSSSRTVFRAGMLLLIISPWLVPAYPIAGVIFMGSAIVVSCRNARIALAACLVSAIIIPASGYSYFMDPWIAGIDEAIPLVRSGRDFFKALVWLSPGLLFLPSAVPSWWRKRSEKSAAAALILASVTLPLALIQSRFTLHLAIASALAFGHAWILARRRFPKLHLLALAFMMMLPGFRGLAEMPSWPQDPSPELRRAVHELARLTESPGNPLDPATLPSYGVVAAWDLGNQVLAISRRPVMADAFHTGSEGRDAAHGILLSSPADANRIADERHAEILFLTDIASSGYALQYRAAGQPIPYHSLFGQLYILQRKDLGWKQIHASEQAFDFELWSVPAIQIWQRETYSPPPRN